MRKFVSLLLVVAMLLAWYFSDFIAPRERFLVDGKKLTVADGDSFSIGTRKLRLDGVDAPEYRQTCNDADGAAWECGKAARAALKQLLREPGLVCEAGAHDRYARALATCSNTRVPDIAAAQVENGFAISSEFWEIRSYPDEEETAKAAKRGIWAGAFMLPADWRAQHPRQASNSLVRLGD
jgi:endonuclease YncB( thermonuclease family)